MSTLKKIAALTIVAGGMIAAGMSGSAEAGCYGGYGVPSYGYGYSYYQPSYFSYPSYDLSYDVYGGNYFNDSYGIRHNCYATAYANQYYYYNSYGAQTFIYGY